MLLRRLWAWLGRALLRGERPTRSMVVAEVPETPEEQTVYLVGENGHLWCAVLLCPCGCGAVIQLNLVEGTRPRWTAQIDGDGAVTLAPSVWRSSGCRSHFFLRRSRIEHCPAEEAHSWVG
jgi:hypothetical protein